MSEAARRAAGALECPGCSERMTVGDLAGIEIDACAACRGTWVDGAEWAAVFGDARRGGVETTGRDLPCPRCASDDDAARLAVVRAGDDVEVDACRRCGGAFLDAGEMARLARAPRSGKRADGGRDGADEASNGSEERARRRHAGGPGAAAIALFRRVVTAFAGGRARREEGAAARLEPSPDEPGLSVRFDCAQCGAPVFAGLDDRVVPCEHCGSWSRLHGSAFTDAVVVDAPPLTDEQLASAWIERRAAIARAEAGAERGEVRHLVGDDLPDARAVAAGRAERERLRGIVTVGERRLLHVPYVHRHGFGHRIVLRRDATGAKRLVVSGLVVEETDPAHDVRRHAFRDANLRLHHGRMRLLTGDDRAKGFAGLPVVERRGPEPSFDPGLMRPAAPTTLGRTSAGHRRGRLLAFAPYWLAEVTDDEATRWLLVDGRTAHLTAELRDVAELERLLEPELASPFPDADPEPPRVVPHRCPRCDSELPVERAAWMRPCDECHVGLARTDAGLQPFDYAHVPSPRARASWFPAWRLRLTPPPGRKDPRAVLRGLGATSVAGRVTWVPARRVLGGPVGDRAFARFAATARAATWSPLAEPLPPIAQERILGATLTAEEAARVANACVAASLTPDEVARMTRVHVRDGLAPIAWRIEEATLVMLPGRRTRHGALQLDGCDWSFPSVVLDRDGGR